MTVKKVEYSRRDFIKVAGSAGLGSTLFSLGDSSPGHASPSPKQPEYARVPKRPFGKTGVDVSILALGGVLKISDKLNASLKKMQTSYVDLYLIHYVSDVEKELTDNVRAWAE